MTMTQEEIAARRAAIAATMNRLKQEDELLKLKQRDALDYGKHVFGDYTVSIQKNPQFQKEDFIQRFPVASYPHFYTPQPDTTKIKKNFSPIELEKFYREGEKKAVVS